MTVLARESYEMGKKKKNLTQIISSKTGLFEKYKESL